jgi:inner membrane protein involved in colicin E2 resistance
VEVVEMAGSEMERPERRPERSPGFKLGLAIGMLLAIPIFSVWFLVYDRQSQANEARASIAAGWGGPQALAGPVLVIPYRATASETLVENGQSVTRSRDVIRELTLAPETATLDTAIRPGLLKRAIYEAVVYESQVKGAARFVLPPAYLLAAAAIAGLLLGLEAVLYILLSLEAYSLLIGSVMTFAALAGVMYATRRIDWSGRAA